MKYFRGPLTFILICTFFYTEAQSWDFAKEKDGIKLYTRTEKGNTIKSYRGVMVVNAPADRVFAMLEDVNHTEWWDKNISTMKVLKYEKGKMAQYYIIYDLPWPVTDRDLCVTATVTTDNSTGMKKITALPLPGAVQENSDMVRIKVYRQIWTVQPKGAGKCDVVLEGFVNPAGSVPEWLANMLIVDSPYKIMSEVKKRMEK